MARQLHVPHLFFTEMISCTKSESDYTHRVLTDPVPPFTDRRS